jgi:hypothetical protein
MRLASVAACCLVCVIAHSAIGNGQGQGVQPDLSDVPPHFRFLFRQISIEEQDRRSRGIELDIRPSPWAELPYDSISLERSPCMIVCPSYTVTFYRRTGAPTASDDDVYGRAELDAQVPKGAIDGYRGRPFPERSGGYTGRIDLFTYARLAYLIQKSNFAAMPPRYSSGWSDERTSTVRVTAASKVQSVADEGEVGPIELWAIREGIDSAAKSIVWAARK